MITKHDDLLGTLVHDVAHLLRTDIDRRLAPYNLTRVKWLALGIVKRNPGISQSVLAEELELGYATVGKLVDRLEERGFLERHPDPDDRRINLLELTGRAQELLTELDGVAKEFRKSAVASLGKKEIDTLNRGLLQVKENLKSRIAGIAVAISVGVMEKPAVIGNIGEIAMVI